MKYLVGLAILAVLSGLIFAVFKTKQWRDDLKIQAAVDLGRSVSDAEAAYAERTYRPLGTTADEILAHENDDKKPHVLAALLWRMGQKSERLGWTNLTDTERRLIAVYAMEGEISDGGFDEYFFNPTGGDADVALAGLNDMGASAAAELLQRAMAQFPGGKPPADYAKRQEVLGKIEATAKPLWSKYTSEYYHLKQDTYALCLAYAKKKRADIILP